MITDTSRLIIAGGCTEKEMRLVEYFDISTGAWYRLKPLPVDVSYGTLVPNSRQGCQMI